EPQQSSSTGAPQQPKNLLFSHRFHLTKTKALCLDCHAMVQHSTSASDSNLPAEKDCLKCHDGQQARRECPVCHKNQQSAAPMQSPARDFRFDHQLHLRLGNLAPVIAAAIDQGNYLSPTPNIRKHLNGDNPCQACHRGLEETASARKTNL